MGRPKEIRGGRGGDYWSVGVAHRPGTFEHAPFSLQMKYEGGEYLGGVTRRQVERLRDLCNEALRDGRGY